MVNERMFINHNYLKVTETKHTKGGDNYEQNQKRNGVFIR